MKNYLAATPLRPGTILTHQGGVANIIDKWTQFHRFLIMGAVDGYYVGMKEQLDEAKTLIDSCLVEDRYRTLAMIQDVTKNRRAAKIDPPLFAYALALSHQDYEIRKAAYPYLYNIAGYSTALFHLFAFTAKQRKISGQGIRKAFASWYTDPRRTPEKLAYQVAKYQQRDGVSHSDILRMVHPKAADSMVMRTSFKQEGLGEAVFYDYTADPKGAIYDWVMGREAGGFLPPFLAVVNKINRDTNDGSLGVEELTQLILMHKLPREVIPTKWLNDPGVWSALLVDMPMEAMLRNLGKMGSIGLLEPGAAGNYVKAKIENADAVFNSGLHPMKIFQAQKVYEQGRGDRGSLTWRVNTRIVEALDEAFYMSFGNTEATGKKVCIGVDLSSSMSGCTVLGMENVLASTAAAIMAMATIRAEPECAIIGYNEGPIELPISARQRLTDVERLIRSKMGGGTDCGVPYALMGQLKEQVDAFVVYTDDAHGFGVNPQRCLDKYRATVNPEALAASVAFSSANYQHIAHDRRNLALAGMDTAVPQLLAQFIAGQL